MEQEGRARERRVFEGVAASSGIGIGAVVVVNRHEDRVLERDLTPDAVEGEVERFREAVEKTRREILAIQERFAHERGVPSSHVLEPHLLMLRDTMVTDDTEAAIRREHKSAEFLFDRTLAAVEESLAATADEYLRERAADLRDVRRRVLRNLRGERRVSLAELSRPAIIVGPDVYPADTAQMRPGLILGFATDRGGRTSHTAILARQLEIPAVVGAGDLSAAAESGAVAIVDGNHGRVILHPTAEDLAHYKRERERYTTFTRELLRMADLPAVTQDGREISLAANVALPRDVDTARQHGAQRIGLFRTEFLFLGREDLPGEEEQFQVYRRVLEAMRPNLVVIRTLDLGEDKALEVSWQHEDPRSVVGWRGIRLCLARPDLLRTQLRAIFRASPYGNLRVMFPMVSGVGEFRRAIEFSRGVMREVAQEMRTSGPAGAGDAGGVGAPLPEDVPLGAMIETPAAAVMARELAREADFFSIGTNDLTQYTLAVDRLDERMAHLFEPLHPAVLRLIAGVVKAGEEGGIPVAVCGEMSADPLSTLILVGLGVDELSVSASKIPEIKRIIRSVHYEEARRFAEECLQVSTASEVRERAMRALDTKFWGSLDEPRAG